MSDFNYELPECRIAKFPLPRRDSSKLLLWKDARIEDHTFTDMPALLPGNSLMVFNETKVVPARMHFTRASGAHIEIFCLEPYEPSDYVKNFASKSHCRWKCIIGNVKRWKSGEQLYLLNPEDKTEIRELELKASLVEKDGNSSIVEFGWKGELEFSEVLDLCGNIPIPPYLNRETQSIDLERYQTTYALQKGSVAAPTAGLHFTPEVMRAISEKGIEIEKVCLHVGAGTFLPVKSEEIEGHTMHREPFVVTRNFVEKLKNAVTDGKSIIAVGTTSVRTLESLFWAGVQCFMSGELRDISQWEAYSEYEKRIPDAGKALESLLKYMELYGMYELSLGTKIIIVPGYTPRIVDILVTNFHQPQSTLLLLVNAFVGDAWRDIYNHALDNSYRFLSYGDSSLLFAVK